ncbi:MAG: OsmC family protein [Gammaproteobacteria bacterium]
MQKFPHHYHAQAQGRSSGSIATNSGELTTLDIAAPKEFDGPGDKWSPEELLVASVADCLILTFRAIANASKLEWSHLFCEVKGTLEMVDRKTQFTEIYINASLTIKSQEDKEKAVKVLEKAENNCLITNSLNAKTYLNTNVIAGP